MKWERKNAFVSYRVHQWLHTPVTLEKSKLSFTQRLTSVFSKLRHKSVNWDLRFRFKLSGKKVVGKNVWSCRRTCLAPGMETSTPHREQHFNLQYLHSFPVPSVNLVFKQISHTFGSVTLTFVSVFFSSWFSYVATSFIICLRWKTIIRWVKPSTCYSIPGKLYSQKTQTYSLVPLVKHRRQKYHKWIKKKIITPKMRTPPALVGIVLALVAI